MSGISALVGEVLPKRTPAASAANPENRRMDVASIGLPSKSIDYINASVQLGKHYFRAVKTGVHGEQMFSGEAGLLGNALLSKFLVTIDEPGGRAIFEPVR